MAIIPEKNNYEVGIQPAGTTLTAGTQKADPFLYYLGNNIARLGVGLNLIQEQNAKIEAQAAANKYLLANDEDLNALSQRKGYNAWKNDDGTFVYDSIGEAHNTRYSEIKDSLSPEAQRQFDLMVAPYQRSYHNNVVRYIQGQKRDYDISTIKNGMDMHGQSAIAIAKDDPDAAQRSLNDMYGMAIALAKMKGADDEGAKFEAGQLISGTVREIVNGSLEDEDIETATKWRDAYKNFFSSNDTSFLNKKFAVITKKRNGVAAGKTSLLGYEDTPLGVIRYDGTEKSATRTALAIHESRNKNFNDDGSWVKSDKDAYGVYQVLIKTARNPGLRGVHAVKGEITAEKLARFAEEYLDALEDRYDGDLRKALAAYNSGFGYIDKFKNDKDWFDHIPAGLRKYVNDIMATREKILKCQPGYYNPKTGTTSELTREQYKDLQKKKGLPDTSVDYAEHTYFDGIKERNNQYIQQQKANKRALMDMVDNQTPYVDIVNSDIYISADEETKRRIDNYAKGNVNADDDKLIQLMTNNEVLAAADLESIRDEIPKKTYAELRKKQEAIRVKRNRKFLDYVGEREKDILREAGIDPEKLSDKKDKQMVALRAKLSSRLTDQAIAFAAANKQEATPEQMDNFLREAVSTVAVPVFWGLWTKDVRNFEMTEEDKEAVNANKMQIVQNKVQSLPKEKYQNYLAIAEDWGLKGTNDQKVMQVMLKGL